MTKFPVIDPVATGRNIRQLRKAKKIKVDEIREFLGLESQQAVYKWQRGESLPTIDNLYALSSLFDTPIDGILMGSKEEEMASSFDVIREYTQTQKCDTIVKIVA